LQWFRGADWARLPGGATVSSALAPMNGLPRITLPARRPRGAEVKAAFGCLALLAVGVAAATPFAAVPWDGAAPLLPAYATAVLMIDLFTATLLVSQYVATGAPALLALAAAYLFNGFTAVAWVASFPGVFATEGLPGDDLQTTAVIAAFRRLAFPIGLLAYAVLRHSATHAARKLGGPVRPIRDGGRRRRLCRRRSARRRAVGVGLSASTPDADGQHARVPTAAWDVVLWASIAATLAAGAVIARLRPFSVLDLWLLVTLAAFLVELVMLGFVADGVRFSLGWWAGRAVGLAAVAVVALALLVDTVRTIARSVTTLSAEVQARRAREASLEALGAAIAHELNQPLAAIVTSAEAASRWLDRVQPDLGQARERLLAISEESARAGRVLSGLRRSFGQRSLQEGAVEARSLLLSVAALVRDDARAADVRLEVDDGGVGAVLVRGDVDQLRQALSNLAINAIEATAQPQKPPRVVTLSVRTGGRRLVLSVGDTGPGISAAPIEAIFEAFRSGKLHGMGLGLMISRTIVEAHGGTIAASNRPGGGALFEITLPMEAVHDR
jgi:signal transduction histidine kinase